MATTAAVLQTVNTARCMKVRIKADPLSEGLLMHKLNIESLGAQAMGIKKIPTPKEEARAGRYVIPGTDNLCIPSLNMKASIIEGSAPFKIGKLWLKRALGGTVTVLPRSIPITKGGKAITEYEIHSCGARVGTARVLRSRALVTEWEAEFYLFYDTDALDEKNATEHMPAVLARAGKMAGLTDWRPSAPKAGTFGKYLLVSCEPVTVESALAALAAA